MSVGYAPTEPPPFDPNALSDEDQKRIAAQMAAPVPQNAPPPPTPTPEPAPTPPTPTQGLASIDPSAVANNIAAVGRTPAPSAPPPVTGPTATPGGVTSPATPETPKQTDELKAAQTEEQKAREASDKAQTDLQRAAEPMVHQREQIANQQVAAQQESIRQQQELQKRYQAAEDAANAQIAQSQDAIKKFKFRDYFSDGEGGTNWVRKIGAALAAAAGAYGAGLTHGPNYALQILNKDMDDAHSHQLDELNKMKDEEVMQRTGLNDIRAARQKAIADLTVNDSARDKLIASQLDQVAARQNTAQFAPSLAAFSAKLKQDAAEKDAAAKKSLVDLNLKLQDEGRKKELDTASINEKNAQAHLANVKANAGGFAPRKGAGGGGSGGGGVTGDAVAQLKDAIEKGHGDTPLTAREIQDKANELHIPAFAKAGHPSVEAIIKSVAFGKNQAGKDDKTANADIDKRMAKVKEEVFGPKGPGTQFERLNGMTSVVSNALKSGDKTAATAVLEEAGGMLSGGKSTKNTVHLLEELRSTKDELAAKWGHLTGDPGASAAFTARLNGLLNRVKEEKRQEIDQIRGRTVDTEMGEHGLAKAGHAKERALGHLSMFNQITNDNGTARYGGTGSAPAAKLTAVKLKDGTIAHFDATGKRID